MKIAIISDVHSNLAALEAVLDHAEKLGAEAIYQLGDMIGYGPQPRECLEYSRSFQLNLYGNHEEAVEKLECNQWNPYAQAAILWTRQELLERKWYQSQRSWEYLFKHGSLSKIKGEKGEIWNHLESFSRSHKQEGATFVHDSPRWEEDHWEYVLTQDIHREDKLKQIFSHIGNICFYGHTHTPIIFTNNPNFASENKTKSMFHDFWLEFPQVEKPYELNRNYKYLVNVGAVGQPRDGDPRASYVIYDGETFTFHRVEYDIQSTIEQVARAGLPEVLGRRLLQGQ